MARPRKPPVVADPGAKAKLEAAAAAAGLSIAELADLVFEAGVTPPPTSDGVTERYTLENLGKRLWGEMQSVARGERGKWFSELVPTQQNALVVVLRSEGFATEVISRELALNPADVLRTWNTYGSELGSQVVGIRLDTIAGQLQLAAEKAQQMATEAGDHSAYWRIHKELVSMLQSIGIVDKAIHRVEVSHKLDDQTRAELDALVALESKQNARRIEVLQLEEAAAQGDELPDDVKEDYDDE